MRRVSSLQGVPVWQVFPAPQQRGTPSDTGAGTGHIADYSPSSSNAQTTLPLDLFGG